jgi:LmbE family N-acetylglucosaminyl deacetylase
MNHIIFSPHLDDAVLCCGGMIAKLIAAGDSVTNQTIFCGPAQPPYSPLASSLHKKWGNPKNMVRLRRAEDRAAGAKLGARVIHGERIEPIYRVSEQGQWLYHEIKDIFGPRNTADNHLIDDLIAEIKGDEEIIGSRLYFPLGIGHHVDHIILFEVGHALLQEGHDVVFYEDFPYTIRDDNFEQRRAELPAFQSVTIPLSLGEMNAKIEAFLYYRSQVPMLFQTFNNVPGVFMNFGRSVTEDGQSFGERLWFTPEFGNPFES